MASKRKTPADVRVSSNFANTLFERLKGQNLRLVLSKIFPTRRIESRGVGTLVMNCVSPTHDDKDPSLYIYATSNLAICKSCQFRTRSLLELLSIGAGISYAEGLQQIHQITGTKITTDKVAKQLEDQDIHQVATKLFGAICNQFLRHVSMYDIDSAPMAPEHEKLFAPSVLHAVHPVLLWLFDTRALNRTFVPYLPYGVVPPVEIFDYYVRIFVDDLVARSTQHFKGITSAIAKARRDAIVEKLKALRATVPAEFALGVTFHTGYSDTLAGRIRIRRVAWTEKTDHAYWNMPGFGPDDPIGYLNLMSGMRDLSRREDAPRTRLIMVESEISALVMQQKIMEEAITDVRVIASAGSNNDTDLLYNAGYEHVDLLMDHPDPLYGKGADQISLKLQSALHVQARVFDKWPELAGEVATIKDPDDVVQHRSWAVLKHFVFEDPHAFLPTVQWASTHAIEEAEQVPASEVMQRQSIAANYGRCVRNPTLLSTYVMRTAEALNLPAGPLRAAIVQLKDDETGLISRIVETMKAEFSILYKDDTKTGACIVMFHKTMRRYVTVPIGDGYGIITALSNVFGEMHTYFCDNIGLPSSDDNGPSMSPSAIRDGQRFMADYLKIAFQEIYRGVLANSECEIIGPGIHYFPPVGGSNNAIIRIHNGNRWFKATINGDTHQISAEELLGPVDEQYVFSASQDKRWTQNMLSVEDIEYSNSITLEELRDTFKRVLHVVNHGWRFRYQHEDALFFTAALFAFAAGDAFDIKLILRVIGESNSGKSTLMSLLCRGQFPSLSLCDNADYQTSYTNASLYQTFDRSRLTMVLEEASQDPSVPTHKTMQMDNINETLRQIIYEGGIKVTRATTNGKANTYHLHTNVAMTTITEPRDVQEANRSYMIETVREDGRMDPVIAINRDMSPAQFVAAKRTIQLGILRHMPELRKVQKEIYELLSTQRIASYTAHSRFLRNFAPIGAILKLMGYDEMQEIKGMVEAKRERQLSQAANSASRTAVDRILRASVVPVGNSRTTLMTPMQCLSAPNSYELLNSSNVGVMIDPNRWLVVIDLVQLMSPGGAGFRVQELQRQTTQQIKATIDQHPDAVPTRKYKELGVPAMLATLFSSASEFDICVLNMASTRKAVEVAARDYAGAALTSGGAPGGVTTGAIIPDAKNNL